MSNLFGSHIDSNINDLIENTEKIKNYGGNLVQIFVDPMNKNARKNNSYENYKNYLMENNMKLVVHASYTINLAKNWTNYSWWITQFILEIELANKLGAFGIVIHLGKQLNLSKEESYNNMYTALLYINNQTKKYSTTRIFIETSSGQGSEMCYDLEDFAYFFNKFQKSLNSDLKDRIKICVDTCHIFTAGYDISDKNKIKEILLKLENLFGLKNIGLIHLNDSKNPLGSKLDRHANLFEGYVTDFGKKKDGIISIISFAKKINIPFVLETPFIDEKIESEIKSITKI